MVGLIDPFIIIIIIIIIIIFGLNNESIKTNRRRGRVSTVIEVSVTVITLEAFLLARSKNKTSNINRGGVI